MSKLLTYVPVNPVELIVTQHSKRFVIVIIT